MLEQTHVPKAYCPETRINWGPSRRQEGVCLFSKVEACVGLCRVHSHERTWRALSVTSQGKRGPEASVIIIFGGVNISVEKKKKNLPLYQCYLSFLGKFLVFSSNSCTH